MRCGGDQLQACRRNDAKRPFGPGQELAQVIAAIILAQRRKALKQAAIRQYGLHAECQTAHRTKAQHLRSPRIGRNQPANRRAIFGAERQGKASPLLLGSGVDVAQYCPRFGCQAVISRVDRANGVHFAQ